MAVRRPDGSWRARARRAAVTACLLLAGCSPEGNSLEGSLGDFYDLDFATVRARAYSSQFSVEYVRENQEVPVRITVDLDAGQPLGAGSYDLVARGDLSGQVGEARMPPVDSGTVRIETLEWSNGGRVTGTFEATLIVGQSDTASLSGSFDTTLELVDSTGGYTRDTGVDAADGGDGGDAPDGGDT